MTHSGHELFAAKIEFGDGWGIIFYIIEDCWS